MPDAQAEPESGPDTAPESEPEAPASLALASDFPAADRDAWRELVRAVLAKSGASPDDPESALATTTYDGITIRPLYTADDAPTEVPGPPGTAPFVRGARAAQPDAGAPGWDVRTRHADPDARRANTAVLNDLETGATSLWLTVGDGALGVDGLAAALEGVYLDLAPVVLDAGTDTERAATALLDLARERGVDPSALTGSLGADPIGTRARTGSDADLTVLARLAELASGTALCVATVDGTAYHDAGASDAQELGIATSVGVAYLRALVDAGLSVDAALARLEFRLAVTAEQFPSIAKLRAARRVWDRVAELSGASDDRRGQRQHAVTSAAMMTRRDPWVNLLRTTIACFAAAVGGAEAITVAPFDAAIGRPDDFSRRIARNTQSVLHDESSLARVADAAGGSWFVESLTHELAEAAWDVFTDIERHGGALARLDDGGLDELIAATRARRDDDIAHRRAPITGVSEFAFVGETPVEREPWPDPPGGPLPSVRWAGAFEGFRDRAEAGERPKVFLATLGPAAVHSARAGFAANLFQAGGIECVTGPVDDFAQSGAKVACLCSSDKVYADEAATAASQLKDAGATRVLLAGKGAFDGVDGTVFAGCDAIAVLRETFDEIGVPA
ncbi:methylmalonyl-CoA mutase family protein [Jatrophihabitans fulvus]